MFVTGESRDAVDSYEIPVVEADIGIAEGLSIFVDGSRQVIDEDGESSSSGWGNGTIGAKWRFFEKDGVSAAIVPAYSRALKSSSRTRGLVEDINVLSLPLVAGYENGDWVFYGQVGYDMTSTSTAGIGYGFWTGYQASEDWFLIAEIYGEEISGEDFDGVTNTRVGFEYGGIGPGDVLFSVGTRLNSDLPSEEKLDYEFFAGYRWEWDRR